MYKIGIKARISLLLIVVIILFPVISCTGTTMPQEPTQKPQTVTPQPSVTQEAPFVRKLETLAYDGGLAIIFRMDDVAKGLNEEAVEQIIRLFGQNNVPVDIGVIPHADGRDSYAVPFLRTYLDVGLIDISVHGNQHSATEFDTIKSGVSYEKLKYDLVTARQQLKQYYGITPVALTVPYDYFSQDSYRAVQDAGFKIFSTQKAVEPYPSIRPVDYSGKAAVNGMSRLCTVSDVARWDAEKQKWGDIFSADTKNELFSAMDWGLKNLGVAVVGIHPQSFLDAANKIDSEKLNKLDAIIKLSKQRGVITTFEAWYKYYAATMGTPAPQRISKTPAYKGGIGVIFRMDDAEKGIDEEAVEKIIKIFEQNKVPVDVGVMPYGANRDTYPISFLIKYLDAGVIDISIHGYKNTFQEFHTKLSGATYDQLPPELKGCFADAYGPSSYTPTPTTYEELKSGLIKARENYRNYYGYIPATITIPYDSFDEAGYRAAQDAGFKVFSSHETEEPYPSPAEPVDYFGRRDVNGMYRLPTAGDVADWDAAKCRWGDILSLTNPADQLYYSLMQGINSVTRLAILRIHPQAFYDARNKVDTGKLNKLDAIIKYILNNKVIFGEIITFQSWYEYTSKNQQK